MSQAPATAAPRPPSYEPFGWHQWHDDFWMSYQFRRGLGETQEGGGAVSEVFQAASKITPNDFESWHREWTHIAERNDRRGDEEIGQRHVRSAMNCWLRAANYFREAEFWLKPDDPRRLATFDRCEHASHKFLGQLTPKAEVVEIPYEAGKSLPAYFIRSANGGERQPVLISVGGLDSFKDELWFMTGRGALQRGMSVLLVDGPGQGGALRRHGLVTRHDYEVPIGKCIDWLEQRADVDRTRIAVSGSWAATTRRGPARWSRGWRPAFRTAPSGTSTSAGKPATKATGWPATSSGSSAPAAWPRPPRSPGPSPSTGCWST